MIDLQVVSFFSLSVQFATAAAMLVIAQAARWRRASWLGYIAITGGLYSTFDAISFGIIRASGDARWIMPVNLLVGTLHAAGWLAFAHVDVDGRWKDLPTWVKRLCIGSVSLVFMALFVDVVFFKYVTAPLPVSSLGTPYSLPILSPIGQLAAVAPLGLFALSAFRYAQRMRAGELGLRVIVFGFGVFLLTVLEEVLVASGVVDFPYLAGIGYLFVILPVSWHLLQQLTTDADELSLLSGQLNMEVRKRTEERDAARAVAIEQQRLAALGRLAAGVGHEINNPLQYLRFSLEELRDTPTRVKSAEEEELFAHAFDGADRIRRVVEDLRTYQQPSPTALERLDVADIVRTAVRIGSPQWRHVVHIILDLADAPPVFGNEGKLVQVVLNPLVNAAQALMRSDLPGEKNVRIATRRLTDGSAEIAISDDGHGFDTEVLARLGEPYVTTKASQGGTGLGLFVSRGIVEAHGGTIHFSNSATGGAVVRIRLPAAPAESAARHTPSATAIPKSAPESLHVLLVEDDIAALAALARGLEREGFTVHGEHSASAALEWLAHHQPNIVVSDLMMPGMTGEAFAEALAHRYPKLRQSLVIMTGGAMTREAEPPPASMV